MDTTLAYALSLGGFLTIALWYILQGRKIHKLAVMLPAAMVFITLGVLSLKYISAVPPEYEAWFMYPTIIMCLIGGMAMLMGTHTKKVE